MAYITKYFSTGNMINERSIFTFSINSCYLWLYSQHQDFNFSIPKGIYFTFFIADCTEPTLFDTVIRWNYCLQLEWKKKPPQKLHFPPQKHFIHSRMSPPIKLLSLTVSLIVMKISHLSLSLIYINFSVWSSILPSDLKHHLVEVM